MRRDALRGEDALLSTLTQALGWVEGADDVELGYEGGARHHARFARSVMSQFSSERCARVSVRVRVGGRVGATRCEDLGEAALRAALERAMVQARACPTTLTGVGFPQPRPVRQLSAAAFDEETAVLGPAAKVGRLRTVFAQAARQDATLAGRFHTEALEQGVVSTTGVRCYHAGTRADVAFVAERAGASGFTAALHRAAGRIDLDELAARATHEAVSAEHPITPPLGDYDVVLAPAAVAEVIEWLALASLTARSVEDGSSFAADGFGRRVTGPRVTLHDEGECDAPEAVPRPFDAEGMPARKLTLLERGAVTAITHDSRSAARVGAPPTGHACDDVLTGDRLGAPSHLFLEGGDERAADLLARVERGLLVTRFHYVCGTLDPRRGSMTGSTRDGLFLIEDGRVTRACTPLRWSVGLLRAFERIDGLSRERATLPGFFGPSVVVAPHLLVRRWPFHAHAGSR